MSEAKHTPGPWIAWTRGDDNADGRIWAVRSESGPFITGGPQPWQSNADARLIAAAPELLEVCKRLFEIVRLQNGNLYDDINAIQAEALAVIAKAKGEK